jgi:hypothetical protein
MGKGVVLKHPQFCVAITQVDRSFIGWQVKVSAPSGWTFKSIAEEASWSGGVDTICSAGQGVGTGTVALGCTLQNVFGTPRTAPQVIARLSVNADETSLGATWPLNSQRDAGRVLTCDPDSTGGGRKGSGPARLTEPLWAGVLNLSDWLQAGCNC